MMIEEANLEGDPPLKEGVDVAPRIGRTVVLRGLKVAIPILTFLEAYLLGGLLTGTLTPLMVIPSNSMSPSLNLGDLILVRGVDPTGLRVGDIIIFDVPPPYDRYTPSPAIHRVVDAWMEGGRLYFRTKGDALPSEDPWRLPAEMVRGVFSLKMPYLGMPILLLRTPAGLALSAILLLLWILYPAVRKT